ncbi:hypothetical protein SDC9_57942 [bioreactor metagenome]|uniref:Uncharacterized protein n=1 Tax=bioreactor metagenome TaxID=1076179 RepID=A0A644X606_9ZZZZ
MGFRRTDDRRVRIRLCHGKRLCRTAPRHLKLLIVYGERLRLHGKIKIQIFIAAVIAKIVDSGGRALRITVLVEAAAVSKPGAAGYIESVCPLGKHACVKNQAAHGLGIASVPLGGRDKRVVHRLGGAVAVELQGIVRPDCLEAAPGDIEGSGRSASVAAVTDGGAKEIGDNRQVAVLQINRTCALSLLACADSRAVCFVDQHHRAAGNVDRVVFYAAQQRVTSHQRPGLGALDKYVRSSKRDGSAGFIAVAPDARALRVFVQIQGPRAADEQVRALWHMDARALHILLRFQKAFPFNAELIALARKVEDIQPKIHVSGRRPPAHIVVDPKVPEDQVRSGNAAINGEVRKFGFQTADAAARQRDRLFGHHHNGPRGSALNGIGSAGGNRGAAGDHSGGNGGDSACLLKGDGNAQHRPVSQTDGAGLCLHAALADGICVLGFLHQLIAVNAARRIRGGQRALHRVGRVLNYHDRIRGRDREGKNSGGLSRNDGVKSLAVRNGAELIVLSEHDRLRCAIRPDLVARLRLKEAVINLNDSFASAIGMQRTSVRADIGSAANRNLSVLRIYGRIAVVLAISRHGHGAVGHAPDFRGVFLGPAAARHSSRLNRTRDGAVADALRDAADDDVSIDGAVIQKLKPALPE